MTIRVLDIIEETMVDGVGLRTSIYFAGCAHKCEGCHNPESWDAHAGKEYTIDELLEIIKADEFANVTFSGGDPFFQVGAATELARRIKEETDKTIWVYTGYTIEKIIQTRFLARMLPYIDVLVDGPFIKELRNTNLPFRGSENQRIIDVKKYIKREKDYEWHLG